MWERDATKIDEKKFMLAWIFRGRNKTDINEDIEYKVLGLREREREREREKESERHHERSIKERISWIAAALFIYPAILSWNKIVAVWYYKASGMHT